MKKTMMVLAMMAIAVSASAQLFDFSSNNGRFTLGLNIGQCAYGTEYEDWGGGASLSVCGVYIDFLSVTPEHKYDNHVTNTLYNDSAVFVINAGYQIPVLPWLRIAPIAGYCQTNYGITDATTVNIEVNENTAQMYHEYEVTDGSRKHYFNYGAGLFIQPIRWVELYGIYTTNAIYGGISINLSAFRGE